MPLTALLDFNFHPDKLTEAQKILTRALAVGCVKECGQFLGDF